MTMVHRLLAVNYKLIIARKEVFRAVSGIKEKKHMDLGWQEVFNLSGFCFFILLDVLTHTYLFCTLTLPAYIACSDSHLVSYLL